MRRFNTVVFILILTLTLTGCTSDTATPAVVDVVEAEASTPSPTHACVDALDLRAIPSPVIQAAQRVGHRAAHFKGGDILAYMEAFGPVATHQGVLTSWIGENGSRRVLVGQIVSFAAQCALGEGNECGRCDLAFFAKVRGRQVVEGMTVTPENAPAIDALLTQILESARAPEPQKALEENPSEPEQAPMLPEAPAAPPAH